MQKSNSFLLVSLRVSYLYFYAIDCMADTDTIIGIIYLLSWIEIIEIKFVFLRKMTYKSNIYFD